ncbi:TAXI family TRAP transporter solute-binding subunit [Desulfovibrio sp. OttesenSCG-928-M16]|nr:TAXI family TRAP transporter solute-binding subunit [Desulfovibrio sp. OttesenSCG-928-M16]
MKIRHIFLFCLVMLLAFSVSSQAHSNSKQNKDGWPFQVRFMAGPQGGNWFALGSSLAAIWSKDVLTTHSNAGGGVSNILNANARKGDMGFSVSSFLSAALRGEEEFKGTEVSNAVIMANLYTQVTYFIVARDFAEKNNIRTVGDLIKMPKVRFATLKPGTASEFAVKALFSIGYDTSFVQLKEKGWGIEYATYEGGADLLADNRIDCFVFSVGGAASIVKNIESKVDVNILAVEQNALDAMADAYGTTAYTIAPGIFASVQRPIQTLGDYTCIVIRKDLPESLVFELNKSLWNNKASLVETVTDMRELSPAIAVPEGIPCHPGSVKFWNSLK